MPRTVLASRVLAAFAATALGGVGFAAAPASAVPVPATLQVTNSVGGSSGSSSEFVSFEVPAPCNPAATRYRVIVIDATSTSGVAGDEAEIDRWIGVNMVGTSSAGLPGPLSVRARDTWNGIAAVNPGSALTIVPGTYEFALVCQNNLGSVRYEEFEGDTVTFTSPTAWVVNDVNPPVTSATTTTSVSAVPASVTTGQNVTLTATVAESAAAAPTGTVAFSVNGGTAVSAPVNASGVASTTVVAGAAGTSNVSAVYSGDAAFSGSTGTTTFSVAGVVVPASATSSALTVNPAAPTAGAPVALNGVVSSADVSRPVPVGTCEFLNGSTVLGSAPVSATGTCSINRTFGPGSLSLTLRFVPTDAARFVGSTSAAVVLTPTTPAPVPSPPTANPVTAQVDGKPVTGEPTVRSGAVVNLSAAGFRANESVTVTLEGTTTAPAGAQGAAVGPTQVGTVVASTGGVAQFSYTVPSSLAPGSYTLSLRGVDSQETAVFAFKVGAAAAPTGTTTATTTAAAAATSTSGTTTGSGGITRGGAALARTGVSVAEALGLAVLLLGTGTVALVAVRRRQGSHELGTPVEPR